jgi:hypothetical protein
MPYATYYPYYMPNQFANYPQSYGQPFVGKSVYPYPGAGAQNAQQKTAANGTANYGYGANQPVYPYDAGMTEYKGQYMPPQNVQTAQQNGNYSSFSLGSQSNGPASLGQKATTNTQQPSDFGKSNRGRMYPQGNGVASNPAPNDTGNANAPSANYYGQPPYMMQGYPQQYARQNWQ